MKSLLILLVLVNCIYISKAQSGSLDKTFGVEGKVVTSQPNAVLHAYSSLLQKDEKIILAGRRGIQIVGDPLAGFLFIRYNTNGIIDSSFGVNGMSVINFEGYSSEYVASMVEQSDGKILACGEGYSGLFESNYNGLMIRLNPDGSIDSTFADNGKLVYDSYRGQDHFSQLLLKPDGKIVICGSISYHAALLVQLLPDGSFDPGFGVNGVVQDEDENFTVADAAYQTDGKIVAGGGYGYGFGYKACIARYLPDGKLDVGFGSNGKTVTNLEGSSEQITSIAIQDDGKIIAGGNSNGFNEIATLLRYTPAGLLDKSFGTNGVVYTTYPTGWAVVRDVALQTDGKIVTGVSNFDYDEDYGYFTANRFKIDGSLDSSFGTKGTAISLIYGNEYTYSMLIQKDGKIILSGETYIDNNSALAMIRLNGDKIQPPLYVRIKHWLHHHGITWEDKPNNLINYYSIQSSTKGNAFTEVARIFGNHHGGIQTYTAANNATTNYRVAAVSNTGNITYSNTLTLTATPTIQLYPNPAKNNLQIQGLPAGATKLTVTDISGNTSIIATANSTVYSINIAQLTSGNYLLHIKTANEVITKQFIKE
jgi:uncharacterized delta-60 repeat protein